MGAKVYWVFQPAPILFTYDSQPFFNIALIPGALVNDFFLTAFEPILTCTFYTLVLYESVSTAWTKKSFPVYENVHLATLLTRNIASAKSRFYCFMSKAYALTSH